MKELPKDLSQLSIALRELLIDAGWQQVRKSRGLTFFYPPESLGIEGKFSLALPEDVSKPGAGVFLREAASSLQDIYGYGNVGGLLDKATSLSDKSTPTRFISRFVDSLTNSGTMPLTSLSAFASNLQDSLYRGAKFKLGSDSKENNLLAQSFVNKCLFMQTEKGSFVAKIEIPNIVLRQADLFGLDPIDSAEITSAIFSGIQFLNEKILGDDCPFEAPEIIENVVTLFDVELLESLIKMLFAPNMETIDFSIEVGSQVRSSSTGWLSDDKKSRLKDFLEFIRDQLRNEDELEIIGSIVELRSRDPEGNKNYISVVADFHGDRTFISAILSNEQYQLALDAHRRKQNVKLIGKGIRLKTQIRLSEVSIQTI